MNLSSQFELGGNILFLITKVKRRSLITLGLVAITSVWHAEGRQFDPGRVYVLTTYGCTEIVLSDTHTYTHSRTHTHTHHTDR